MDDPLLTLDEAAARLRCSKRTLREWLRIGKLHGGVKVGWQWRIPASAVEEFIHHPKPRVSEPDPLETVDRIIEPGGTCTRFAEWDQRQRDLQGRPCTPPGSPEG